MEKTMNGAESSFLRTLQATRDRVIEEATDKEWRRENFIALKHLIKDSICIEGALLACERNDSVYLAPNPQVGLFYELRKEDILDALATGRTSESEGKTYAIVQLWIKTDAVLIRNEWMLASDLANTTVTAFPAEPPQADLSMSSLIDPATAGAVARHMNEGGGGGSPRPEPTPREPTPRPGPRSGGIRG